MFLVSFYAFTGKTLGGKKTYSTAGHPWPFTFWACRSLNYISYCFCDGPDDTQQWQCIGYRWPRKQTNNQPGCHITPSSWGDVLRATRHKKLVMYMEIKQKKNPQEPVRQPSFKIPFPIPTHGRGDNVQLPPSCKRRGCGIWKEYSYFQQARISLSLHFMKPLIKPWTVDWNWIFSR